MAAKCERRYLQRSYDAFFIIDKVIVTAIAPTPGSSVWGAVMINDSLHLILIYANETIIATWSMPGYAQHSLVDIPPQLTLEGFAVTGFVAGRPSLRG